MFELKISLLKSSVRARLIRTVVPNILD